MLRASRRGLVDLIIMIIMIVFLLGMGTLAFMMSDRAKKEELYLAKMRELPEVQRAEIDSTRAKLAQVSGLIGFKGQAEYSSPEAIATLVKSGGEKVAPYYKLTQSGDALVAKGTVIGQEDSQHRAVVKGADVNDAKLYGTADGFTLQRAIAAQDQLVQSLVSDHIPRMKQQHELQRLWRDAATKDANNKADEQFRSTNAKIEAARQELENKNADAINQEGTLTTSLQAEMAAAESLVRGPDMLAAEMKVLKSMLSTEALRKEVEEIERRFRLKASNRLVDDSLDPDGYVFLVDENSGWLWINIGQLSDVRLEQTFTVYRADANRSSKQRIGSVRVKEVMKGNIARCRVDTLEDNSIYPRSGDIVMNETFSSRQYLTYALVGKFGGKGSDMTRQEWIDKLTDLGFIIHSTIRIDTDAVLIGADWQDDPVYKDARDKQLNFQTFTERQMYWFLGITGPDADSNH